MAHPWHLRLVFRSKKKNDRVDAPKLAKLIYLGEVPIVHVPSPEVQAWRGTAEHDPDERQRRERSNFLAYVDGAGRFADFHAPRHTFITNLARGGVHPRTAQALARHSAIKLTMDRYSHTLREQERAALAHLPDLPRIERRERATGTAGAEPAEGGRPCALPERYTSEQKGVKTEHERRRAR